MGTDHLGGFGTEASIILKRILEKQILKIRPGLDWLKIVYSGGIL